MSKPEKRYRCGLISASIWPQGRTVDGKMVKFYSINIDRAYKEGDEWKHSTSFAAEDLPKVALVANEAYKYLRLNSTDAED